MRNTEHKSRKGYLHKYYEEHRIKLLKKANERQAKIRKFLKNHNYWKITSKED